MGVYTCEVCREEGREPFQAPAGDHIGVEIMRAHLEDSHGIVPLRLREPLSSPEPLYPEDYS